MTKREGICSRMYSLALEVGALFGRPVKALWVI
jgi:hypothetical protein